MSWPTTIDAAKGDAVSRKPLHLVSFADQAGAVFLRVATNAVTWGGQSYLGRIVEGNIGALGQSSADGLDVVPNVSITLADADKAMYFYRDRFYGATMAIDFVLWDVSEGTYSTDSYRQFTGRCGKPECNDLTLDVGSAFVMQLGSNKLPTFPIQQRCPKIQPQTTAEFAAAQNDESIFAECALTASDYTGPCNQSRAGCAANNHLLYFGGVQYNIPDANVTREYVSKQQIDLRSNQNAAKWGDWVPIVLGTAWVDCAVTNTAPEANSTRGEAIIAEGVSSIQRVTVNDEKLPAATSQDGGTQYPVDNVLFRYNVLNTGNKAGRLNQDNFYSGQGDPYGSMAAIEWCVPRKVESSGGIPRVRALVQGKPIRVYTGATTYTTTYSDNFAWNILYVLSRVRGMSYARIDLASFVSAAAFYAAPVSYTDQNGSVKTHARATCSMVIRQRTTVADVISGLLRGCNSILRWNTSTGLIELMPKGTIADQQPSPMAGSNYATPVPSQHANGTNANGYAAYRFTTANLSKRQSGEWNIRRLARSVTECPNAVSFSFTNADNEYVTDSITTVDADAINAAGQQVDASVKCDGIATLDQAKRVSRTYLDEIQADQWEIESDFGALKVGTGHIVLVDVAKYDLVNQPMRVLKVAPSMNSETIKFTLAIHDDGWYLDDNGQYPDNKRKDPRRNRLERPAYAWAPYEVQPPVGDAMYPRTDWTFAIQPTIADLYGNAKQALTITGKIPVNSPPSSIPPPAIARQGSQGSAGTGHLRGGNTPHYFCVSAIDQDGNEGMPSDLCEVVIAGAGETYSATIPVLGYDSNTQFFKVYGYHSTVGMTWLQQADCGETITVTEWNDNAYGCPDGELSGIVLRMRQVRHGGVAGQIVTEVGENTLTVPGAGTGGFDWTGRIVTLCAKADRSALPIWNSTVVSQAGDLLTMSLDPTGVIAPLDVVLLDFRPTWDAATLRATDTFWKNPLSNNGYGLAPNAERLKMWRCIAGTGRGESGYIKGNGDNWVQLMKAPLTTPDATSRWIIEEPYDFPEIADTPEIDNADLLAPFAASIPTDNYKDMLVRVEGVAYDGGGNESPSHANPERLIWLLGDFNERVQPYATLASDTTLV